MPNKQLNDQLLVDQLISGNKRAFKKLFDLYGKDIALYCNSILRSERHSEEIVQEVFIKIWENRKSIDPNQSFKSYIFTITRNHAFNFLKKAAYDRKLKKEIFYTRQKSYNTIENDIIYAEYNLIKEEAIKQLPPKRRLIFEMSRNQGKNYNDISQELGISPNTVKNQMSKALDNIKSYLLVNSEITFMLLFILTFF